MGVIFKIGNFAIQNRLFEQKVEKGFCSENYSYERSHGKNMAKIDFLKSTFSPFLIIHSFPNFFIRWLINEKCIPEIMLVTYKCYVFQEKS